MYIGQLEQQMYKVKIEKFEDKTYFEPVYQGSVQIYKVKKEFWVKVLGGTLTQTYIKFSRIYTFPADDEIFLSVADADA